MARYPSHPGRWVTRDYGGYGLAWTEAKRQTRATLYEWAAADKFGYYTDLANRVTAIPWPEGPHTHEGHQIGYLLGQVALEELDRFEDRPIISALVVGRDTGMPSGGYWDLRNELGLESPSTDLERLAVWTREFKAACEYYGRRLPK
jgi:hypothetical protein